MDRKDFPERLSRQVVYESDFICLYTDRVRMPDGSIIEKYHQLHHPRKAASVVVFDDRDRILLIHSKRYTVGKLEWEVPSGGIEEGELPAEAARRECFEETGCKIRDLRELCTYNPASGMSDEVIHIFGARLEAQGEDFDRNEVAECRWATKAEVLEMLKNNETPDGVSIIALFYALQFYK